jgi:hypothetical protein
MSVKWKPVREYTDILYEHAENEAIAKITINRPKVRNAFRPLTVRELLDAFTHARDDGSTGVILFTGARDKVAKKTYIRAPKYPQPAFDKAYAECKADKSWRTFETTTAGHDVMVDDPAWLTGILLKVS